MNQLLKYLLLPGLPIAVLIDVAYWNLRNPRQPITLRESWRDILAQWRTW